MEKFRKCKIFGAVLVFVVMSSGFATNLPDGAYYRGTSYFNDGDGALGRVNFAVYDTDTDGDPFASGFGDTLSGSGRYIYAYQITRDSAALDILEFFSISGIGDGAIDLISNKTEDILGTVSDSDPLDPTDAIDATDAYFNVDLSTATWEFDYDGGHIIADEYSYFLLLKSDSSWTNGSYSFLPPTDEVIPVPDGVPPSPSPIVVPEPFSVILLGLGSVGVFSRRRKKVK